MTNAADEAHDRQRRGTLQLLVARGVFFASAYVVAAILTRALGPSDYGIYGVILSQLFWLEMVVQAGIPAATSKLIADGRHDREEVARAARALLIGFSSLLLLAGWVLAPAVAEVMRIPNGGLLYRLALIDLPFAAFYASYEGILYGHRRFRVLALALIAYGVLRLAAVSALVLVGYSIEGALLAVMFSSLCISVLLASRYPPRGFQVSRRTMAEIIHFAGPMALCLISGQMLLTLDLWSLKSLWTGDGEVVGEYVVSLNLARTLSLLPAVQAGVLFSSVAWATASRDKARALRHIQEATRFAIVIAAGACVVLAGNGADMLALLFSSAYAEGQRFLALQLVAFALFALLDVFANALMATGRQRVVAVVLTAAVPVAWVLNYVLIPRIGATGAAISLVLGVAFAAAVTGTIAYRQFGPLIRFPTALRVFIAASAVGFAGAASPLTGGWVVVEVLLLGGLYLLALFLLKEIAPRDFGFADKDEVGTFKDDACESEYLR